MAARHARPVVLVVDDDPGVRDSLRLDLDDHYEVLDAPDGRTAISLAGSAPIDLVLLDVLMPEMDGLEVLARLDIMKPQIPVVLLSGLDKGLIAVAAMQMGAVDYVTKPYEDEILRGVLDAALHRERPPRPRRARPALDLFGCDVELVAALAATLETYFEVRGHPGPPAAEILAGGPVPALIVVEMQGRRLDALERVAVVLDRYPMTPIVALSEVGRAAEARFIFGTRCLALERPFALTALLDLVYATVPGAHRRPGWRDPRTAAVINAVHQSYGRFDLRMVADRLGASPYHLSRRFREHAGLPLGTYVRLVKVHAAEYLLATTDEKIEAVATAVGFHDASHLSRAFVKLTGRRPGQSRPSLPGGR